MTTTKKRSAATALLLAVSALLTSCAIIIGDKQVATTDTGATLMSSALGTNGPPIIVPGTIVIGGGSKPNCPGTFTAAVTFTDQVTGAAWFTPPAGSTSAAITDVTGLQSPYLSNVESVESFTTRKACATTSVTFSVSPNRKYQFTTYVISSPPPAATTLKLQVQWYK